MRGRRALALAGALGLALGGCSRTDDAGALDLLRAPGGVRQDGRAGVSQGEQPPGAVVTFGTLQVCALADVTVTGVRLVDVRGPLVLRRWAITDTRRIRPQDGAVFPPGPLESRRPVPTPGPAPVVRCVTGDGHASELIVEVEKATSADGCASAVDVDYTDGTRTGTYRIWLALGLTQAPATVGAECA